MAESYFPQPSVMTAQQHFSQVPSAEIERSRFDRSHGVKTTFDSGFLVPIFVDEYVPGDSFSLSVNGFCRLATPLKPIMDNMFMDIFFFDIPYRLVWDNWQAFCGERKSPDDDPSLLSVPICDIDLNSMSIGGLAHYLGIPYRPGSADISVSALPFRAYFLVWNEWFRDQNLQVPAATPTGDGPDSWTGVTPLYRRGKRHDYFTSCLPWPQKGDPVIIPLGDRAPVRGIGAASGTGFPGVAGSVTESDGLATVYASFRGTEQAQPGLVVQQNPSITGAPNVWADLTEATSISINDLRSAFQIQRLLERDARGGTRYNELILSHFGVRSDDARLQRPAVLGMGSTRININPVASTAPVPDAPQANLAAFGTASPRASFKKSFTEHGIVLGLVSVRADLTYQQGLERMWSRRTRYDFYWPALSHLGEQAVLNKEIYVQGTVQDNEVFGYQERYAEYRYKPSKIQGLFVSQAAESLDVWHLSQDFATLPVLNASFIEDNPPIQRIIAVPSEPQFLADFWFDFKCDRPMPVYSVPGLIDHF